MWAFLDNCCMNYTLCIQYFNHKKLHYLRKAIISIYNHIENYILLTTKSRSWCWPVRVTRRPAKRGRRCGTVDQLGPLRPRWGSQFWQKIFPIRNIDVIFYHYIGSDHFLIISAIFEPWIEACVHFVKLVWKKSALKLEWKCLLEWSTIKMDQLMLYPTVAQEIISKYKSNIFRSLFRYSKCTVRIVYFEVKILKSYLRKSFHSVNISTWS